MEIRAIEVTDNATGDAPMPPWLLDQIAQSDTIASVSGDGAYDTKGCHEAIARRGAQAIIPTRKNAKPWKDRRPAPMLAIRSWMPHDVSAEKSGSGGLAIIDLALSKPRCVASNFSARG